MSICFIIYRKDTGEILGSGKAVDLVACANMRDGTTTEVLQTPNTVDNLTSYLRLPDMTIQPRTALPAFNKTTVAANGTDAAVVSGLPNPTQVAITGDAEDAFTVTDGSLSLAFETPGTYNVQLDAGALYIPNTTTLTAT